MKTLSLKLPETLDAELTAVAAQRGESKSTLVRRALENYLSRGHKASRTSFLVHAKDLIGSLQGPPDLSVNKDYLRGYGK